MKKLKPRASMPALACVIALAPLGAAHAVTIDVNPGTLIQDAINRAQAGDTVRVLAGTYKEKVSFQRSGTANAPITLKADPGVKIDGTGLTLPSGDRTGLITIRDKSYIRVEGFELANFSTNGGRTPVGILFEGTGAGIQIVGNSVHHIKNNATCSGDNCPEGAHGIAVIGMNAGVTDVLVQNNEVYANVLQSSEAVVINGNVDRFEILGNKVHDNNNIGIDIIGYEKECGASCGELDRARNGIVRGNVVWNNTSVNNPAYPGGDRSAGGFYVDGGHHIIFDRNVSYNNDIGFEFASEHLGKLSSDILMTNNVVYNNFQAALSLGGSDYADNGGAARIYVNNNTFYKNNQDGHEIQIQNRVSNVSLSNNIIYGKTTIDAAYYVAGTGNGTPTWLTNLWWSPNGGTKKSARGVMILNDPLFVAPEGGNLNLQGTSPAINRGNVDAAITGWSSPLFTRYFPSGTIPANGVADFGGDARVQGAIDVGADEAGPAASGTTPPAAPSQLLANSVSSSQVNLSWSDNATDETGVRIERSTNATSGFAQVVQVAANTTAWQDTGLTPATSYFYRVSAYNAAGTSATTAVAGATTAAAPAATSITIDGNGADWANIATLSPAGTGGLTALKAYADATYLYLLVTGTTGVNYDVLINKDNASTTGLRAGIWSAEGSDYLFENGTLHKYAGTGTDWTWNPTGVTQSGIQAVKTGSALELKIPRASLAGMGPTIRIGVHFSNSSWTGTGDIPSAGSAQAQFTF